ncbi:MAG TPA: hypothetical protein PLV58_02930 [Campylobacterales bacterium]|nr:hypothetical protein [Campylobacterales bacterium]
MIDGIRGVSALRELTALVQNLDKKLSLPITVEVLQKIVDTKDGFKYFANIDGVTTEVFSRKELELGAKYWADGVKKQNLIALENLVEKPQILSGAVFKNDVIVKALGFDKLVELIKNNEAAETPPLAAKAREQTPQTQQKTESAPNQSAAQKSVSVENPNLARTAAADAELTKSANVKIADVKVSNKQDEPKKTNERAVQESFEKIKNIKEEATKELAVIQTKVQKESVPNIIKWSAKEEPIQTQKEAIKEAPKEVAKEAIAQKTSDEKPNLQNIKERLNEFKNVQASLLTKEESEKIKADDNAAKKQTAIKSGGAEPQAGALHHHKGAHDVAAAQREQKLNVMDLAAEPIKADTMEKIAVTLAQNFEGATQSALLEATQQIMDAIFGKLPEHDADEAILKILEQLEKKLNEQEVKGGGKKRVRDALDEEKQKEGDAQTSNGESDIDENANSKTDSPVSKLKAQLLEEIAKTNSKSDFQMLSNVAISMNNDVFTFVLKDKGVLQFRKTGANELIAKTVQFYSAFETLGPIGGEITHVNGHTSLSIEVEFESSYRFLKENLKELSFFDRKNVSIKHGIKEIQEIKNSFLDAIG